MERYLLDAIPISVTLDSVIKDLRLEDEDDIEFVSDLFAKAKKIARPKALYKVTYIDDIDASHVITDGVTFTSDVLAHNLKGVHRVFAYICTCGTEVDEWSRTETDYIVSLWLDFIKERFAYDATSYLHHYIKERYGFEIVSSINPGSGNVDTWPIEQQKLLFSLIGDVTIDTGVILSDSFLMIPTKSTSGILYPSATEFINCSLCERKNCPNRHAAYSKRLVG